MLRPCHPVLSLAVAFGSVVLVAVALALLAASPIEAAGVYPAGATGVDLTWSRCAAAFPNAPQSFAIISASGGRAFYANPCLISEWAWAQAAAVPPSYILNLNSPVGTTAFEALSGPKGSCASTDDLCLGYNFGFNAARSALAYVQSQGLTGSTWWLDVETSNSWSENVAANDQVIQGAIDYLRSQSATVGIYSTSMQWNQIAGSFSPGLPNWVAGAPDATTAPSYCAAGQAFGGGSVWLVQYPTADYNSDYACP